MTGPLWTQRPRVVVREPDDFGLRPQTLDWPARVWHLEEFGVAVGPCSYSEALDTVLALARGGRAKP